MMKQYTSYKTINFPGVKEIPDGWTFNKLSRICYIKGRIGWQGLKQSEFTKDGPYLITGMNFKDGKIRWDEVYHITQERYEEAPEIQLKVGDVLMTKDGTIGKLLYVDSLPDKASLNSHLLVLRPLDNDFKPKYLYYLLQSEVFKTHIELYKTGTTFYGITQEAVGRFKMILPSLMEQEKIVNFLDYKLSKIDELISKKQKLIVLLNEERTAIINQAVTKGIDQTVPMKDSGVEWIGKIPEHWEVSSVKRVARIRYGLGQPPAEWDNGKPLIRATNVKSGRVVSEEMLYVDPKDIPPGKNAELSEGEIIVVRSGAYTGDSAIITKQYEGAIAGYDMVVTVTKGYSSFIAWQLLSQDIRELQFGFYKLRAAQPHLNAEELGGVIIMIPPTSEQHTIASYLDHATNKIDLSISKIQKEIDLFNEYRTAFISEVVTGKLDVDVREEVAAWT